MRIVHVVEDLSPANTGITSAVREFARAAVIAGHHVEIVATGGVTDIGVPSVKVRAAVCDGFGSRWRYAATFDSELIAAVGRGAVVHIHGMWMYPQWRAVRLAMANNWPVVITPHNMLGGWLWRRGFLRRIKKRLYFELLLKRLFENVGAFHALSQQEHSVLASEYFPFSRVVAIPNALDLQALDKERDHVSNVVSSEDRYVLFLGRLHPVKGIELLIEAVARLGVSRKLRLIVAGPASVPEYEEELKHQVRALGVGHRVTFVGAVYGENKWRLIMGAWVFCAPSHSEGMSMAALEAMAASVPVITTHGSGLDEVELAGGMLVRTDPAEISLAIEASLGWTMAERKERGLKARRAVEQDYSWPAMWPRYEALYDSLIN